MKLYVETRLFNLPVADLCEWALGEAGQLKLNWQPIDLVALIGATVTNFTPVAEERNGVLAAQIDWGRLCCGISSPMRCVTGQCKDTLRQSAAN